jgi:murein L,D-transpeptidase YcbB/YkuD
VTAAGAIAVAGISAAAATDLPSAGTATATAFAAQLAKVNGLPPAAANQLYDAALARQVREFQAAQGLDIDGVAGAQTMMHLNSAAGVDEPRLKTSSVNVTALSGK